MKIKAGYGIIVDSWENDFDNFRSISVHGLTENEICCYVELAILLGKSSWEGPGCFGNIYNPSEEEVENFEDVLINIAAKYTNIFDEEEHYVDYCQDMLHDMFGSSDYFTRRCEDISVYYIPEEITLANVTDKFIKKGK